MLGIALLPFLWLQVRYALYPQLAPNDASYGIMANARGDYRERMMIEAAQKGDYATSAAAAADAAAPPCRCCRRASHRSRCHHRRRHRQVPRLQCPRKPATCAKRFAFERRALNSAQVVQRYAAGTVLQAGPGIPAWGYNSYDYYWSGPVESADTVRFIYVGPVVLFFWRLLGVFALAALFAWLALLSYGKRLPLPGIPESCRLRGDAAGAVHGHSASPTPAQAASGARSRCARQRSARPSSRRGSPPRPDARRHCAEISAARVTVEGDRLEVVLQVSALATVAVAMPHASDRWQLDDVSVDARGTLAMARDDDASLWVPLTAGAHTVRLAGRLASAESIQLAFPQRPRVIDVSARGWTTSGVNEGRLVSGSLELARERDPERSGAALEAGAEFPGLRARRSRIQPRSRLDARHHRHAHRAAARRAVGRDPAGEGRIGAHRRREGAQQRSRARGAWRRRKADAMALGPGARRDARSLGARRRGAQRSLELRRQSAVERGLRRLRAGTARRRERAFVGVSFHAAAGRKADAESHASEGRERHDARHRFGEPAHHRRIALVDHDAAVRLSKHAGWTSRHQAARTGAGHGRDLRRAAAATASGERRVAVVAGAGRAQPADLLGGIA